LKDTHQFTPTMNLIEKYHITVLDTSDEIIHLAEICMKNNIIPKKKRVDALHIAIASVNELGMILSFNFKHINKLKTNDIEDQVDAIRDKIYEEIKDMTSSEETAYFNAIAEEARKKYNFRVIKSAVK